MYQTSTASRQDFPEILRFLERRLLENAWVIWFVHDGLGRSLEGERVVVCRFHGQVVATACVSAWPFRGPRHYGVHMDSADVGAVGAVLETLPGGIVLQAQLFTPRRRSTSTPCPARSGEKVTSSSRFHPTSSTRARATAGKDADGQSRPHLGVETGFSMPDSLPSVLAGGILVTA